MERRWLRWGFDAEDVLAYLPGGDAAEFTVGPGESTESVLSGYRDEVERARHVIAAAALTDRAALGGRFATPEQAPALIRILFHLLQEYARHVGHLDIASELVGGPAGE